MSPSSEASTIKQVPALETDANGNEDKTENVKEEAAEEAAF